MFRFNRNTSKGFSTYNPAAGKRNSPISRASLSENSYHAAHRALTNILADTRVFKNKIYSKKDELARLTSIRDQRYTAAKSAQIGSLDKLRANRASDKNALTMSTLNTMLPKPRDYNELKKKETVTVSDDAGIANILNKVNQDEIDKFKQNDSLAQRETVTVTDQAGIANILNQVSEQDHQVQENNNISEENKSNIQTEAKQIEIEQPQEQVSTDNSTALTEHQFIYVITPDELIAKLNVIVEGIQLNVYMNPRYDFAKLIQFVYTMYEKFAANPMALMIITKGLSQFNKKQMFKLPDDKITDIITYIINQIKKQ